MYERTCEYVETICIMYIHCVHKVIEDVIDVVLIRVCKYFTGEKCEDVWR
jgi:hypothetical protein